MVQNTHPPVHRYHHRHGYLPADTGIDGVLSEIYEGLDPSGPELFFPASVVGYLLTGRVFGVACLMMVVYYGAVEYVLILVWWGSVPFAVRVSVALVPVALSSPLLVNL